MDQTGRVAGNFGELRSNHLHAGIDYKTNEKEGLPVYAAADGYVSRIRVASGGYGKAVYITHPDRNTVTVYGHLRSFVPSLNDTLLKLQKASQKYDQELFPSPGEYPVAAGMIIGYSGNTGSSQGPHLHFETRHLASERPFNPELAGFAISDTVPPVVHAVALYEPGPGAGLSGSRMQLIDYYEYDSTFRVDTILTTESFFVGFEATDRAGNESNVLGIRGYKLFLDDSLVFTVTIDSFSFDETRMINGIIDYPFYQTTGRRMLLAHALPGNTLSFYGNRQGILSLPDTAYHSLRLEVFDTAGNRASTHLIIKSSQQNRIEPAMGSIKIPHHLPGKITRKSVRLETETGSFFEDQWLLLETRRKADNEFPAYSATLTVLPRFVPAFKPIAISLRVLPHDTAFNGRLLAAELDSSGKIFGTHTGTLASGWFRFTTRSTGSFVVIADTAAPVSGLPFYEPDDFSGSKKLVIPLSDDLSGIRTYQLFINGEWVPAAYESSRKRIVVFPEDIPGEAGEYILSIGASDAVGNTAIATLQIKSDTSPDRPDTR